MAKKSTATYRQKKFTRKDLAEMSATDYLREAKMPYKRLMSYVWPYKTRFFTGVFFGIAAGLFNLVVLFGLNFVVNVVLDRDEVVTKGQAVDLALNLAPESTRDTLHETVSLAKAGKDEEAVAKIDEMLADPPPGIDVPALEAFREKLPNMAMSTKEERPFNEVDIPFRDETFVIPVPKAGAKDQLPLLVVTCMMIPLLILIRGMLGYLHSYCMMWVGNRVLYNLRNDTFSALMQQSMKFFGKARTGDLMQTVFNQTRMAQTAGTQLASDLIKHPISLIAIVIFLLMRDPVYTFAALVVFPICILPVVAVSKKVRKAGGQEETEAGQIMVTMQESFAGIKVVKGQAREAYELKRFNGASEKMLKFIMRWQKAMELVGPLVETVASVGIATGLIYAFYNDMKAGDFMMLNVALMSMYPHAKALSRIQVQLQKCLMATSKIFAIIDEEPDIKDKPDAGTLSRPRGQIELDDVCFSYKKDVHVLKNVSMTFEAGKTYALVGLSGAGKSTLLSLIMRFYDPLVGKISFDGQDIKDLKQSSVRDHIGMVNQDTFLFHDTIYENIRYGRLDATKAEIEEAAKKAFAHQFILDQESGYETELGDQGSTISGGQQQRLSIARAILRDAPILLLDEATSALDSESEAKIKEALEHFGKGKTVIAIAHRLSTILNADQIVMMKDGMVIDVAPHETLLRRCEDYQRLYDLQFHGGQTEFADQDAG